MFISLSSLFLVLTFIAANNYVGLVKRDTNVADAYYMLVCK